MQSDCKLSLYFEIFHKFLSETVALGVRAILNDLESEATLSFDSKQEKVKLKNLLKTFW
jgi:hypothetical protein